METSNHLVAIKHYDGRIYCYFDVPREVAQERFLEEVGSDFSREHLASRTLELDFKGKFIIHPD